MFKSEDAKIDAVSIVKNCAIGAFIGLIGTLLLLYLFAALISGGKLDVKHSELIVIASAFVGASIGGTVAAKREKRSVLPVGAAAGFAYFVLLLLLTALGTYGSVFGVMTIKLVICGLSGGVLGGSICLGKKKKRKSRRAR